MKSSDFFFFFFPPPLVRSAVTVSVCAALPPPHTVVLSLCTTTSVALFSGSQMFYITAKLEQNSCRSAVLPRRKWSSANIFTVCLDCNINLLPFPGALFITSTLTDIFVVTYAEPVISGRLPEGILWASACLNLTVGFHLFVSSESTEMDHCPAGETYWQQTELLIRKARLVETHALSLSLPLSL